MKTIITCALTGAATLPEQTPYLPITPEQIAQSGLEAVDAGASVLHIHVRDPQTGRPSMDIKLYEQVVNIIKQKNSDVLINLTTGAGATFFLTPGNLTQGGPRSLMLGAEARVRHIELLKPDLCSFDFNTMHQGNGGIRINHQLICKEMARRIVAAGTKPEVELFDSGDFRIAKELYDEGLLGPDPFWQLAMGVKYGWDNTPEALVYGKNLLPASANWSAFGLGRMQMQFVAMSMCHGGHVRVGLEDNIYLSKGVLAQTNAELVTKAVSIIESLGGDVASPQDARAILKL
jgi:uncharacterized protein (DUF849 family)